MGACAAPARGASVDLDPRWHPCAVDPAADCSAEPTRRVAFTLDAVEGGTLLTIDASGFAALPPARRAQAFEAHERGWSLQARLLGKYLAQ